MFVAMDWITRPDRSESVSCHRTQGQAKGKANRDFDKLAEALGTMGTELRRYLPQSPPAQHSFDHGHCFVSRYLPFRRLYGDWFVGFRDTPSSEASD